MKKKAVKSIVVMLIAVLVVALTPVTAEAATKTPGKVTIKSVSVSAVSTSTNKCTMTDLSIFINDNRTMNISCWCYGCAFGNPDIVSFIFINFRI